MWGKSAKCKCPDGQGQDITVCVCERERVQVCMTENLGTQMTYAPLVLYPCKEVRETCCDKRTCVTVHVCVKVREEFRFKLFQAVYLSVCVCVHQDQSVLHIAPLCVCVCVQAGLARF